MGESGAVPVVGVYATSAAEVREGEPASFEIRRVGPLDMPCSVHWAVAPRDAGDVSGRIGGTTLFGGGLERVAVADQVYEWTYNELFARYQDRLVYERVHNRNTLIKGAYEDTQPGGAEAWNRGVDVYKRLWGGTKAN